MKLACIAVVVLGFLCVPVFGQGTGTPERTMALKWPIANEDEGPPTWPYNRCKFMACTGTVLFGSGDKPIGCNSNCVGTCEWCNGTGYTYVCSETGEPTDSCTPAASHYVICGVIVRSNCYWATPPNSDCWCNTGGGTVTEEACEMARCDIP